jgi:hypothetical protein
MTKIVPSSVRAWAEYSSAYNDKYRSTKDKKYLIGAITVAEESLNHINSPIMVGNMVIYKKVLGTARERDWQRFYQSLHGKSSQSEKQSMVNFLFDNYLRGTDVDEQDLIKSMEIIEKQGYGVDYLDVANKVYISKRSDRAIIFFKKFVETTPANDPNVQKLLAGLAMGEHAEWVKELEQVKERKTGKNE